MKKGIKTIIPLALLFSVSCSSSTTTPENQTSATSTQEVGAGQSGVQDESSAPNVVQIAVGSKDHSTLVAAVKAASLVDVLSNAGPFTVFAPVNAAFEKLPAGTVEGLLKPEKLDDLKNILEYHVYVGVIKEDGLTDGRILNQVNGGNITITLKDGKPIINGKAHIVASIPAANGIIHVIDEVLLPQ
ncbi:MAG: fasciclin domain-containing protein [Candidatus Methylacidiphilales bacterium]